MSIIGTARLCGRAYELHRDNHQYIWWLGDAVAIEAAYSSPAEAVDALWQHLGLRVAADGWWEPAAPIDVDVFAAKRPRTVTKRDVRLGRLLAARLEPLGLCLDNDAGTGACGLDYGLLWQEAAQLAEEVRVETELELLAKRHGLKCRLIAVFHDGYAITRAIAPNGDKQLATGATPAEAVEQLRRELERPTNQELLRELRERGVLRWYSDARDDRGGHWGESAFAPPPEDAGP